MTRVRFSILPILYRLYERRLLKQVCANPIPHHIGIILDGNRRYGRQENLKDTSAVYTMGAQKLDDLLEWCVDLDVEAVTLWVLSTENLKRSPSEVSAILTAIEAKLVSLAKDRQIHDHKVHIRTVGRLELLPPSTLAAMRAAEAATKHYGGLNLTIAVAYGGRLEIVDAVRSLLNDQINQGKDLKETIAAVTPEAISRHLYAADLPDADLIIRTSGEIRLSGFLLWQSAHSEFYFTDVYWPAFRRIDFLRAVRAYQQRQRRFGR